MNEHSIVTVFLCAILFNAELNDDELKIPFFKFYFQIKINSYKMILPIHTKIFIEIVQMVEKRR